MAHVTQAPETSRNELTDSLLHTNVLRIVLGGLCGLPAGAVMLAITTLFTPAGSGKLWWIHLMGSAVYHGRAMAYAAPSAVIVAGLVIHFGLSVINGLVMGKMTTSHSVARMAIYGLVLGGLCWLASNMFAPDFMDLTNLDLVGQWERMAFFVPMAVSLGIFLAISSKALDA